MSEFVSERFKLRSRDTVDHWYELAACQGQDYDLEKRVNARQRELCAKCPVAGDCLREALELESGLPAKKRFGIRGGKTPRERYDMQRGKCLDCHEPVSMGQRYPNRYCDSCGESRRHESKAAYEERLLAS